MMLVTSGWMLLAMPKSISFREAFTMTKLAGFKSLWTIPVWKRQNIPKWLTWINCQKRNVWQRERLEHYRVCVWCGPPPACSSSRTFSPVGWLSCGSVAKCSDPGSHTPSACRCSGRLIHCGDVEQIHSIRIPACLRQFRMFSFNIHIIHTIQQSIVVLRTVENSFQHRN